MHTYSTDTCRKVIFYWHADWRSTYRCWLEHVNDLRQHAHWDLLGGRGGDAPDRSCEKLNSVWRAAVPLGPLTRLAGHGAERPVDFVWFWFRYIFRHNGKSCENRITLTLERALQCSILTQSKLSIDCVCVYKCNVFAGSWSPDFLKWYIKNTWHNPFSQLTMFKSARKKW